MPRVLTYKKLKQMVIKEMQLSLGRFGIKETAASEWELQDALQRWKSTTERGRKGIEMDWYSMSQGQEVLEWDYDSETDKSFQANIREKHYEHWADEDFKKLLNMVHKEWEKK